MSAPGIQLNVLADSARDASLPYRSNRAGVRTRNWHATNLGRNVIGKSMYPREHHFPNVYSGVMH